MMVSMAEHLFFSTICWCLADKSDSPPGGNACQYMTFFSGQAGMACAAACCGNKLAKLSPTALNQNFVFFFILSPASWQWC
jgi:hypothetical protein